MLVTQLRTDHGNPFVDRVEDAPAQIRVVVEHDPEHRHEHEQQREERDEPVVREQGPELAASILSVAHEGRDEKREPSTSLLPAVNPLEHHAFSTGRLMGD